MSSFASVYQYRMNSGVGAGPAIPRRGTSSTEGAGFRETDPAPAPEHDPAGAAGTPLAARRPDTSSTGKGPAASTRPRALRPSECEACRESPGRYCDWHWREYRLWLHQGGLPRIKRWQGVARNVTSETASGERSNMYYEFEREMWPE